MAKTTSWVLPGTITPAGSWCFQIHIPADPAYFIAFSGALEALARAWNWDDQFGDGSTVAYNWQQAIDKAMECFRGDSCCMPILRKNPANECVVEQSYDCGETWVELINLLDCVTSATAPLFDAQSQYLLDNLLNKYTGVATSISEKLGYTGEAEDAYRDAALCAATELIVDAMCDAEIERRLAGENVWDEMDEFLWAASIVVALIPIPGFRFLAAGLAFTATFVRYGLPLWEVIALAALQDENAREQVACSMYNALRGETPTEARFAAALDTPLYSPVSVAFPIGLAIKPMLAEVEVYVTFLDMWAKMYDLAEGEFLVGCPCPNDQWTAQFLGDFEDMPNYIIETSAPYPDAVFSEPNNWFTASDDPALSDSSNAGHVRIPSSIDYTFKWIIWDIAIVNDDGGTNPTGQRMWIYDELDNELDFQLFSGYHKDNTPAAIPYENTVENARDIVLQFRCYEPADNKDTVTYLHSVIIHGEGTIPPEWIPFQVS